MPFKLDADYGVVRVEERPPGLITDV